jgi:hypothetical protein
LQTFANYSNVATAAFPYTRWSGGNEYLLVFVSSKFQSGRAKLSYTPTTTYNAGEYNTTYSVLVDLGNTDSMAIGVCVSVGWGQSMPFKKLRQQAIDVSGSAPAFDADFDNGQLYLEVINPLVGPDGA